MTVVLTLTATLAMTVPATVSGSNSAVRYTTHVTTLDLYGIYCTVYVILRYTVHISVIFPK